MITTLETPISGVKLDGVSKTYLQADTRALNETSLEIAPGEFVSLVGPSGCGKSTLLKIVAGLIPASGGRTVVHGKEVIRPPKEIGMMFQKSVLLEWRTAKQNILLPIELQRGRRAAKDCEAQADHLLELVGLAGFGGHYPNELSGGMQQRVSICRMLIADPPVLLLDEPFGALDELSREHLNVELARLVADSGKTALLVTHNIQEAVFLSDRVVIMSPRPGRITGIVPVPIEQPRQLDVLTDVHFQHICRKVRAVLDEPGQPKAAESGGSR